MARYAKVLAKSVSDSRVASVNRLMSRDEEGRVAEPNAESLLRRARHWKSWGLAQRRLKEVDLIGESLKAAVYSGQTSKIIGIAVATTRISSGKPMRQ